MARSDDADAIWRGVGDFIRGQREMANLSLRQLADIAKISNPYLSQIERGLHKPSADVLKNLASALKISAETMYAQAGLLDGTAAQRTAAGAPAVEDAIRSDARLSEDQKQTLVSIYRGFVERA
ncbi:MAG TPA: helix-turn-helix transcriptional regulator [Candidatus Elarobacter sp.]